MSVVVGEIDAYIREDYDSDGDFDDDSKNLRADVGDAVVLNPLLHDVIPDPHELVQLLHHSATYGCNSCFMLIGGDKNLIAVYKINFTPCLVQSYKKICDGFYEEDLKVFYEPGKQIPQIPDKWVNAFQSPKLRYLKMDEDSFLYHIGIW